MSQERTPELITDEESRRIEQEPDGFIEAFTNWLGNRTDAAPYGINYAALAALSLSAGETTVSKGRFTDPFQYLNLYLLVVGPSTKGRKTTLYSAIRRVLPKNLVTGEPIIREVSDVSPEALTEIAAKSYANKQAVYFSDDEIAHVFKQTKQKGHYRSGLYAVLLQAYDHTPILVGRTQRKASEAPEGAFLTFIGFSTPDPLAKALSPDDVHTGLMARFMFGDLTDVSRGARPPLNFTEEENIEYQAEKERLRDHLAEVSQARAPGIPSGQSRPWTADFPRHFIPWSDDAENRFAEVREELDPDQGSVDFMLSEEEPLDDDTGALYGRGLIHVNKLAPLYALSRAYGTGQAVADVVVEEIDVLRAANTVATSLTDMQAFVELSGGGAPGSKAEALAIVESAIARWVEKGKPIKASVGYVNHKLSKPQIAKLDEHGGTTKLIQQLLNDHRIVVSDGHYVIPRRDTP